MILRGEVRVGERLPSQRDLSRQLGLSRASLREAISILETLGLVRTEPGRGVFVSSRDSNDEPPLWRFGSQYSEEEVYQLRLSIEPEMAALAALRIDAIQLAQLRDAVEGMRRAFRSANLAQASESDGRFHRVICEAARNRMLAEIYENMAVFLEESQRRPMIKDSRLWETLAEHEALLKAIEKRNPQLAYRKMRTHIQGAASRVGISVMSFVP